jgi:hypothetical protein
VARQEQARGRREWARAAGRGRLALLPFPWGRPHDGGEQRREKGGGGQWGQNRLFTGHLTVLDGKSNRVSYEELKLNSVQIVNENFLRAKKGTGNFSGCSIRNFIKNKGKRCLYF